ncbi:MAG TPA: hypothetical protein VGZ03_00010 [Acidimicrobiales bacterium]|jgi:hypothetical protein|nr:hypothetical protein [Acidimicrobiales bacterium]
MLGVVVLCSLVAVAAVNGRADAQATPPLVRLLHVTPTVTRAGQPIVVTLTRSGPALAPGATVQLTLFSRMTSRSAVLQAISPQGPSGPVSTTGLLPASCVAHGTVLQLGVPVAPDGTAVAHRALCGATAPVLRLGPGGADGVYPLRVTVTGGGTSATIDTLVTFATARAAAPLHVAWMLRIAGGAAGLAGAVPALQAIARHPIVPVTIDVQGSTLAAAAPSAATSAAVALLRRDLALPAVELLCEAYVPAELGTLRASALPDEVVRQFALDDVWLDTVGITTEPAASVTYGTGPQTPTSADALASIGYHDVVVPGAALTVDPVTTLAWGTPFRMGGAPAGATALASDTELSTLSDDTSSDPGLAGANMLGELAFLHFEQPNLPDPRVAVVVTDATAAVTASFVDTVLSGLAPNPNVTPITVSSAFRLVPLGANGFPAVRDLALGPSLPFPQSTTSYLQHLRITTDSLSSAVRGPVTPIPAIEGQLLSAEQPLPAALRTKVMLGVQEELEDQLGYFRIYNGPITLTQAGASLPITIFSTAPYSFAGFLHLSSPKLTFPQGATIRLHGPIAANYSLRVAAHAEVTGDIPLLAQLWSPKGQLVMTHAVITVRATQTSIVGIALTVLAVLVLGWWWIRTSRRRRSSR